MLIFHIVIATILTLSALTQFSAGAVRRKLPFARLASLVSLALTAMSGTVLALTYGGLGKFCLTMTVATLAIVMVDRFYVRRLQTVTVNR